LRPHIWVAQALDNSIFGGEKQVQISKMLRTLLFSDLWVITSRISEKAHEEIQNIIDSLTTAESEPNKIEEIERIRRVCQSGKMAHVKLTQVDLFLEAVNGDVFLFDLKTVKPNAGNGRKFKRTLLEWVAAILAQNPHTNITTALALPYNPEHPNPYNRWTLRGMLDVKNELFVAEEFWDFLGGKGAYEELLNAFEHVGTELRPEIDKAFAKYLKTLEKSRTTIYTPVCTGEFRKAPVYGGEKRPKKVFQSFQQVQGKIREQSR